MSEVMNESVNPIKDLEALAKKMEALTVAQPGSAVGDGPKQETPAQN